jgi:putative ABC transport system permease protein
MAVGSSRGAVLQLVFGEAAKLVGVGIGLGLAGAVLLARMISSLLYGIAAFDVTTVVSVSILLAIVALVASYVPARRAANVNPMDSLRYE